MGQSVFRTKSNVYTLLFKLFALNRMCMLYREHCIWSFYNVFFSIIDIIKSVRISHPLDEVLRVFQPDKLWNMKLSDHVFYVFYFGSSTLIFELINLEMWRKTLKVYVYSKIGCILGSLITVATNKESLICVSLKLHDRTRVRLAAAQVAFKGYKSLLSSKFC